MKKRTSILALVGAAIIGWGPLMSQPVQARQATPVLEPPPGCNNPSLDSGDGARAGRGRDGARGGGGGRAGRAAGEAPPVGFGGRGEHKLAMGPDLGYVPIESALPLPEGMKYDSVAAVGVNSKGHVFVYDRGPKVLFEFDQNEKFVRAFGEGYAARPHGLRIDSADNIWITDVSDNTVMKLNPAGQIVMILGTRCQTGTWDEAAGKRVFNQPTDLTMGPKSDIYVADTVNFRVQKLVKK